MSILPSFLHRSWCLFALHTALVLQLPVDVALASHACNQLCQLLMHNAEAQLCDLQQFSAHCSESGRHAAAAMILSHYEDTCGFGDVSHVCREFWMKDVIARVLVQLQHSQIDIEDAMAAAAAASEAQQAEGGQGGVGAGADVALSGVASLMWRHMRMCMAVAHVLAASHRHAEAEDKFRFCFVKRRGVVGACHPDTLRSQHALAEVLLLEGKCAEAAAAAKECCSLRCTALGPSHHDSLSSM